jgi:ABC-2 type transport system ATP-binding protein
MEATYTDGVADDVISSLSHGFKQRVGIAQAIVHRPKLLVLDEPISGLDPVQIVEMREMLRSLKGEHTILLSSHILSEISETCDRILVIRDGQIAASGTENQLFANLQSSFRLELTIRETGKDARELLMRLDGVTVVEPVAATEQGDRIATLQVGANKDVREAVCKALVEAGVGLLEIRRTERELESVFLQLAGSAERSRGRERRAKAKAAKPNGGGAKSAPQPSTSGPSVKKDGDDSGSES